MVMFIDGNGDMNNGLLQDALARELDMYDALSGVCGAPPIAMHRRGGNK